MGRSPPPRLRNPATPARSRAERRRPPMPPRGGTLTGMHGRGAREVVEEMFRRLQAGDDTVLDELVAEDMVNHAAGPQGRSGLSWILRTIDHDLGPVTVEQHHL